MSHTTKTSEDVAFIHNSDLSGNITISSQIDVDELNYDGQSNVTLYDIEKFLKIQVINEINYKLERHYFSLQELYVIKALVESKI